MKSHSFLVSRGACWCLGLALTAGVFTACSDDDGGASPEPVAGAAGESAGQAGAPAAGGASGSQAGAADVAGVPGVAGAAEPGDGGGAGVASGGAGGASARGGDCFVELSENTSNATDAAVPLRETCRATIFDGQINFEALEGMLPDGRDLNIDFFAPAVQGASVKLEDGYDYDAHRGAAASYMDSVGVWNADSGTLTLESVVGDSFVVKLENVHFAVLPGQPEAPTAMGEFVANGTITATAIPASK